MKLMLKKWLIRVGIVFVSLFLIGYCFRDFWVAQLRVYLFGLIEVRSDQFGHQLPDADEVEVMSLGRPDFSAPDGPAYVEHYAIAGRSALRGEDAAKVVELWRSLRRGRGFAAMCHDPIYALRFRQQGKLLYETTICWHCHSYTIPWGVLGHGQYGFDADREDAQDLLRFLKSHVPLPIKPAA